MKGQIVINFNIKAKTEICEEYEDEELLGLTDEQLDEKYDNPKVLYTQAQVEEICLQSLQAQIERVLEEFIHDENSYTCDDLALDSDYELKDIIEAELKVKDVRPTS